MQLNRLLLVASLIGFRVTSAQTTPIHDPERAQLVSSDLPNFWRAYDRARRAASADERARIYVDACIRPGSAGLRDWARSRLESGQGLMTVLVAKGWSEERLRSGRALTDSEKVRLRQDTSGMGDIQNARRLVTLQHRFI